MIFFYIISSATLGLALVMLFTMYRTWCQDFQNRVTRDHPASPSNPKRPRPRKLDMDHTYLSFLDYLWVSVFVGLPADLNWAMGLVVLKFREKFCQIHQPDYNALCGQLALGTNFAAHFTRFVEESDYEDSATHTRDAVAEFCVEDFSYVINSGHTGLELKHETLRVLIQLKKDDKERHRLWKAWVGRKELTAQEAYLFINLRVFSAGHAQTHAIANWGVNPENYANPFLRKMSVITVMYNYYGLNGFNRVIVFLQSLFKPFKYIHKEVNGLPAKSCEVQKAQGHSHIFNIGFEGGVIKHSKSILNLTPYSDFVSFIVKVRKCFGKEFEKHQKDFPGVDMEGLFIGTVMHSLDHSQAGNITKDPLWLQSGSHSSLQWMEEWCRFVRCGFTDDLPGIIFKHKFKDAPHPFFNAVYDFAHKLDPELADGMDCCIIK